LLISAPGLTKAGTINHTPVIGTDFLKTITRIAGIESPPGDGVDLYPVLQSKPIERDTFTWHYPHYWAGGMITPYSVIRSGKWKLIRWYEFDEVELYDLHNDPSEKTNLATNHAAQVKILSDKLAEILTEQGAQMPIPRNPPSSVNPSPLNRAQDPKYFAD
jgi:arylsulfatase A-like enzyme